MKHHLELYLWARMTARNETPRDITERMLREGQIQSPKQVWRTLEKWTRKGQYEYGCSLDLGWLTGKPIWREEAYH